MYKSKAVFTIFIMMFLISFQLTGQEAANEPDEAPSNEEIIEVEPPAIETPLEEQDISPADDSESEILSETPVDTKKANLGNIDFFLDSKMIFALSVSEGGFGFGETANIQYILPFNLGFGIESGYYGFRSEVETDGPSVVGGFTLIPIFATASYNIPIVRNIHVTPVVKFGGAYSRARINGWAGEGETFSAIFEGGVRFKVLQEDGLLIQGGITYTGLIEKSGLFSIMSLSFGLGFDIGL